MIGSISGKLIRKKPPEILVEVQGIGYEILVPINTFYNLPELNANVNLLTHLLIREESHTLYGFISEQERALFRILIKISGIGPKVALSILSTLTVDQFIQSVRHKSTTPLTKVPGVGKKTAERLLLELSSQLSKFLQGAMPENTTNNAAPALEMEISPEEEALQALVALGYSEKEAQKKLSKLTIHNQSCEQLIRLALRQP